MIVAGSAPSPGGPSKKAPDLASMQYALLGRLAEVSLFDICQFLMLNRKTGTLTARYEQKAVYLTFKEGQLLNAVDHALKNGEEVILAAVQWPDGTVTFEAGPVPPERRIQSSTENVLLEAARLLDEMSAGDLLEEDEDGERPQSHVDRYQETNRRSAELSEAFRTAVSQDEETTLGSTWKESIIEALRDGRAERLVVGPASTIHLVHGKGVIPVEVPSFAEVEEWLARMVTVAPEWSPFSGRSVSRWGAGPEEMRLWVSRHSSPDGVWFTVAAPSESFPDWYGMGFDDDLAASLRHLEQGPVVLGATSERFVSQSIAAFLSKRAAESPELVWVLESAPSFAWSKLPGRIRSLEMDRVSETGDLVALCERTKPRLLVLRECRHGELLQEALSLVSQELQVLIASPGSNAAAVLRTLDEVRARGDRSGRGTTLASILAGLWWVQPGSPEQPYPVRTRFLVEDRKSQKAA